MTVADIEELAPLAPEKTEEEARNKPHIAPRTAARLLAVQGLYQMSVGEAGVTAALTTINEMKNQNGFSEYFIEKHDEGLTEDILRGAVLRQQAIDALINDTLPTGWTMKKLDEVAVAILRASIFEMLFSSGTPAKIVINEYMNLASSFGLVRETNMINGMLNALARNHNLIT